MDSETLEANENGDLNAVERLRWGNHSKVYTRKNYRKRVQLESSNNDSAITSTAVASTTCDAEPTSSAPVKNDIDSKSAPLEETLAIQNGNSSGEKQEQPEAEPSRSEGEPSTSDAVQLPEEDSRAGEEEQRSHGDQEVLPDGREDVPNGGREEPTSSSGYELPPQMEPTGGQEIAPNGGEEQEQEVLPELQHTGEQEQEQEVLPNTREEPMPSSGDEALPQMELSSAQVVVPNGEVEPPPTDDPEVLPELQPTGEQEHEVQPNTREEPMLSSGYEPLAQMEPTSEQDVIPSGGVEPSPNDDPEILPELQPTGEREQEQEVVPTTREEPAPSSGDEALQQMESTSGQVIVPNDDPEVLPELHLTGEEEQEAQPNSREEPPEGDQSDVAVTVPRSEGPDVTGGDRPVNGMASAVLVNGFSKPVITRVQDRIRINISGSRSKDEMRKLKRKLESELGQVRTLVERVEAKELKLTAYRTSNAKENTNSGYGGIIGNFCGYDQPHLVRANSEVGTVGHQYSRPQLMRVNSEVGSVGYQEPRPFRHLTVSVMENNHGVGEIVEKEKRTPKANQYYRNSEFLLGKDRLPPERNKKLKLTGKKHGSYSEYGFGKNGDKVFKSCSNLLQRLMKHKHGWVFNEPVDAKKLNIPDYHIIIKHPMDLGTIKTRLAQNWYKSPKEFAEDVRLVFRNAMTYNPKGQDVHVMAEELSMIFEERWMDIEKEYFPYQMYYDAGLPVPTPRKVRPSTAFAHVPPPILAPVSIPPAPLMRTLDRSQSMMMPVDSRLKTSNSILPHIGRTPAPKKPKAKDPNKRDMTYEEKQKLSTNLQSLPSEKLDAIVQIIKKRNSNISQHNDEIEVDIDSVDAETLWELDRFVTNYKKSLSKIKRKAELALQRRAEAAQAAPVMNPIPAVAETQKESRTDKNNPPVVEVGKQGDNVSGSSSSSSSSSDSGSSSSDSDSESSSGYGSEAGNSPKT